MLTTNDQCHWPTNSSPVPIGRRHTASLFTPPHVITAYIISVGILSLHSALIPPSPRLISPQFLFSLTRKIPPSEKCSCECYAFLVEWRPLMPCLIRLPLCSAAPYRRPVTCLCPGPATLKNIPVQ